MTWIILTIAVIAEAVTVIYFVRRCETPLIRNEAKRRILSGVWDAADRGLLRHEDIDSVVGIVSGKVLGLFEGLSE